MRAALTAVAAAALTAMAGTPALAAKDTVVLGMVLEPPHLDPTAGAAAAIDEVTYHNVFEGLTRIDRTGAVQPALAEKWTVSPDGLTYSFDLRDGVTFHDGTAFDCSVVKFSYERATAADSVNAQKRLFEPIASVACPDPGTAVVTLKRPTSSFLYDMGWGDAAMVAPNSAANNKTAPVGTGPFKLKRWAKGDRVELERHDAYWGPKVALKAATFRFIADPAAATAAVLSGDVDGFPQFPAAESIMQFRADPRFAVVIGQTEGETILALNNAKKPFDDVRVRRALAHAIDRKAIVDGAMSGFGTVIGSHVSPTHPAYVDLAGTYAYDPAKAKALLAEAGVAPGTKVTLKLPPPPYARRSGEIIAAQLAKVGITAEIVPMEWAQWLEQVFRGSDFDMTIVAHTEPMDIEIYARDKYYFNYQDAAFKDLYRQWQATLDPAQGKELLAAMQRKLAADEPNVFLFQLPKLGVWNAKLKGLWENFPTQAYDLTEVSWAN
jgi:peptide/nickel transport system substrate-binding protein